MAHFGDCPHIIFTSLNRMSFRTPTQLLAEDYFNVLHSALTPVLNHINFQPAPDPHEHEDLLRELAQRAPFIRWTEDSHDLLEQISTSISVRTYLDDHTDVQDLFREPTPAGDRAYLARTFRRLCYEHWLAQRTGGSRLQWIGRQSAQHPQGCLTPVFRIPDQVHPASRPSMLLGTLEITEVVAIDWLHNDMAVYLKSLGFWRAPSALIIPAVGSPLIAMYYLKRALNSMSRDLTKAELGEFTLQDAKCRHAIKELCSSFHMKAALTQEQVNTIETNIDRLPHTLTNLGDTYQEHCAMLLRLFLATFKASRFLTPRAGGLEAIFVLSINHPDAFSPEVLATVYINEPTGTLRIQRFPNTCEEAFSFPHVKVFEITATFTSGGNHAVRLSWDNKSIEQPTREGPTPTMPIQLNAPPTPMAISTPVEPAPAPPLPPVVEAISPNTLRVVLGQLPLTATGFIISMIRFGWDFTRDCTTVESPLEEITAGITTAGYMDYIPRDEDGSRDEYIRSQILLAREQHHLLQDATHIPFHTYEVYIPFTAPQDVGHGTTILHMYEIAKQSNARWERTAICFQCVTATQLQVFKPENRVLFSRVGNLGESHWDGYCSDALKQVIALQLPPDASDILVLRTGVGQTHSRPPPGDSYNKRNQNRNGNRVQSVGGLLTVYFDSALLDPFMERIMEAITGPRGVATQPQWTSFLQDASKRRIITGEILRHHNPALIKHSLLHFDLYLETEFHRLPVAPLLEACNVVEGQFFSLIHLQDVPMTQVINQLTITARPPPEWKLCVSMPQWRRPNTGDVPLHDFLPNRRGPCLLIVTSQEARLSTIRIGERTYPLDAHNMHPILVFDRQSSTLGNLMYTAELPNAGHFNRLSASLCDRLRVPICSSTRPISSGGTPLNTGLRTNTTRPQTSYLEVTQGSITSSQGVESSLTSSSSSDPAISTLAHTLSLLYQRGEEEREENRAFRAEQMQINREWIAYMQRHSEDHSSAQSYERK